VRKKGVFARVQAEKREDTEEEEGGTMSENEKGAHLPDLEGVWMVPICMFQGKRGPCLKHLLGNDCVCKTAKAAERQGICLHTRRKAMNEGGGHG